MQLRFIPFAQLPAAHQAQARIHGSARAIVPVVTSNTPIKASREEAALPSTSHDFQHKATPTYSPVAQLALAYTKVQESKQETSMPIKQTRSDGAAPSTSHDF